jgi:coenzyme F420 hydrogenase subunit beta
MKSFTNLIQDVQKPGLCHRCGGCVTFCSAVNFGALELDPEGKPRYADMRISASNADFAIRYALKSTS